MRKSLLLLLLLLTLGSPLLHAGRRHVYHLSDYGIRPGLSGTDLSSRLQQALDAISAQAVEGEEVVVRFQKGRYDFYAADARPQELYISNHDQDQPKRVAITLDGVSRLTLDGNGAELIFHGRLIPLAVIGTTQCTLRRFSIDFERPQIAQAEILDNSAAGTTFRLLEGTRYRVAANGCLEVYDDGWAVQPQSGIAFDGTTRHILYDTSDLSIPTDSLRLLPDGRLLAPHWHDERLVAGTRVALRSWERPCPGLFFDGNRQTTVEDVTVHYAEGMGLLAQRCDGITLRRFRVSLRGKDDPRYFTTQADATHFSQCRGHILSERGLYEGMMDDAINVHGVYLSVRQRLDDHTLRCRFEHEQAYGFAWGDVGDTVSFIRSLTMDTVGRENVIAAIRPADRDSIRGCMEYLITFREALPAAVTADGYGVENLTWTPTVTFRRNTVRNNRARGALFSSPRRTLCENNLFDHTSGTAILLCGDCNGWYESGAVRDLVIRKNRFVNALTNQFQFTNAIISIYPEIPELQLQQHYFHGGAPRAIVIEDNTFDTFDAPLLYAKSVYGLIFQNNTVKHNTEYPPLHWNRKAVWLEHCKEAITPGYVERPATTIRVSGR